MLTFFQVCFFVGIGLIVLSVIFGSFFEAIGIDGLDLDFDVFGVDLYLPVSPVLFILFSTVFGGVGWILIDSSYSLSKLLIIIIAVLSGLLISLMVSLLVIKPLKKAQNTSSPSAEELVGVRATVTETIFEKGFGEISYIINGNSYNSPAKSTNGEEIIKGKDVAICWIENYVFYVTTIEDNNLSSSTIK